MLKWTSPVYKRKGVRTRTSRGAISSLIDNSRHYKQKKMPVINNIPLTMSTEQVLRRQGIQDSLKLQPHLTVLLRELLSTVNELLEPAIVYELYSITEVRHDRLRLENGTALYGSLLPSLLTQVKELGVAVCTIGPHLEEKVTSYFGRNEPLRGLILDGIGSTAVDCLAQKACQFMNREALSCGHKASSPLSPGMSGWPVSEQWHLFQLVPAEQIGVHLTSSAMMVPRKSISMVIGIGPAMPTWKQAEVCDRCGLKETCTHKVHT